MPISSPRLFAVIGMGGLERLRRSLQEQFPDDHYDLGDGTWLIVARETAKSLSDKLGVSDGPSGSAIVLLVSNYYGRAKTDIWEWIDLKMSPPYA
jgi:hypothetical protein